MTTLTRQIRVCRLDMTPSIDTDRNHILTTDEGTIKNSQENPFCFINLKMEIMLGRTNNQLQDRKDQEATGSISCQLSRHTMLQETLVFRAASDLHFHDSTFKPNQLKFLGKLDDIFITHN